MPSSEPAPAMTLSAPAAFGLACKAAGPLRIRATHRLTGRTQDYSVNSPYVFLGRSPATGVRLDDPSISQGHAYVQVIEGIPFCIDLGSRTGVIWNDGTQGQGWVTPDHTLRMGAFDVRIDCPSEAAAESGDEHYGPEYDSRPILTPASVEIQASGRGPAVVHLLDRAITLGGRHPSCDLRLLDDSVAYFQCALVNTADGVWVVDAMTRKGAIVNGRVTRLSRVRNGDLLELGKMSLVVRIGTQHAGKLAVLEPDRSPAVFDPVAAISTAVAESLTGAFVPVAEMMKQFQQCYMAMTQMFVSMQQEHASLVSEQMRQIQDLATELRSIRDESRREGVKAEVSPAPAPAPPVSQPAPQPRAPSMKLPEGADGKALSDAHAWFMERMSGKSAAPPAGS